MATEIIKNKKKYNYLIIFRVMSINFYKKIETRMIPQPRHHRTCCEYLLHMKMYISCAYKLHIYPLHEATSINT